MSDLTIEIPENEGSALNHGDLESATDISAFKAVALERIEESEDSALKSSKDVKSEILANQEASEQEAQQSPKASHEQHIQSKAATMVELPFSAEIEVRPSSREIKAPTDTKPAAEDKSPEVKSPLSFRSRLKNRLGSPLINPRGKITKAKLVEKAFEFAITRGVIERELKERYGACHPPESLNHPDVKLSPAHGQIPPMLTQDPSPLVAKARTKQEQTKSRNKFVNGTNARTKARNQTWPETFANPTSHGASRTGAVSDSSRPPGPSARAQAHLSRTHTQPHPALSL
jgi:hypothetical protein